MNSPFPKSSSSSGAGSIVVARLPDGSSRLEAVAYQYPLKLIAPPPPPHERHGRPPGSALVFLLSYGGGLVGGDRVDLAVEVREGARLSVVTQGHTKVFPPPAPGVVTGQALRVRLAAGAALCLLPDPVQPFEGSVYEQAQVVRMAGAGASLCLLDWVTRGRAARGEDWSLARWVGRNEVWAAAAGEEGGRLLVRDAVVLDSRQAPASRLGSVRETMHGLGVFGTLILRGPLTGRLGDFFLAEFAALPRIGARDFGGGAGAPGTGAGEGRQAEPGSDGAWRARRLAMEKQQGVLWSAASVRGCVVVKFGAPHVEAGRSWIGSMLVREGSIAEHFGDQALMCVR